MATLKDFYGRNAETLLENFAGEAHGTGMGASNIGMVSAVGDVKRGARCMRGVRGQYHRHVGLVCSPGIRIVEQREVPRPKLEFAEGGSHRHGHRSEVDGHV